jgi:phosphate acyltransferase
MRIAVDAMGGDLAPREIVRGAINYAATNADEVILVGDVPRLEREVDEYGRGRPASVSFVDAPEVVEMGESPTAGVRRRRSSIRVATDLVRDGSANAVVSAGSTGATMAAAIFRLGRLEGIDRPALPAYFLTPSGPLVLLDVGANVDCEPRNLVQFGAMGSLYAERVLHVDKPRVGLLNIGEESEKGDALSREAFIQFAASDLNFVGNVEPHELASSPADVVVCDGFVGNVVLKLTEGLTSYIFRSIREDLLRGWVAPIAVLALRPGIDRLRHRFDYEQFGGSPLLGVRGVSIVTHGRAKARMVENAIRVGSEAAAADIPAEIADWSRRHPNLYGERSTDGGTATSPQADEKVEHAAPGTVPVEPAP